MIRRGAGLALKILSPLIYPTFLIIFPLICHSPPNPCQTLPETHFAPSPSAGRMKSWKRGHYLPKIAMEKQTMHPFMIIYFRDYCLSMSSDSHVVLQHHSYEWRRDDDKGKVMVPLPPSSGKLIVKHICLSACLFACLSVCLSVLGYVVAASRCSFRLMRGV